MAEGLTIDTIRRAHAKLRWNSMATIDNEYGRA
jgi:hypothetical protein